MIPPSRVRRSRIAVRRPGSRDHRCLRVIDRSSSEETHLFRFRISRAASTQPRTEASSSKWSASRAARIARMAAFRLTHDVFTSDLRTTRVDLDLDLRPRSVGLDRASFRWLQSSRGSARSFQPSSPRRLQRWVSPVPFLMPSSMKAGHCLSSTSPHIPIGSREISAGAEIKPKFVIAAYETSSTARSSTCRRSAVPSRAASATPPATSRPRIPAGGSDARSRPTP